MATCVILHLHNGGKQILKRKAMTVMLMLKETLRDHQSQQDLFYGDYERLHQISS